MGKLKTYIGDDIDVTVEYDYQPYEHMTKTYPGCDASATVTAVYVSLSGEYHEIEDILDLLKDEVIDQLEMRCMVNEVGE